MKKKYIKFCSVIILMTILIPHLNSIKFHTFKEDILYSEKNVDGYSVNNIENENYLTRDEAIKKGVDLFQNGFGIDLNRKSLKESIYLNYSKDKAEWTIMLTDNTEGIIYYYSILVDESEVTIIGITEMDLIKRDLYGNNRNLSIDMDSLIHIVKPLASELNIKLDKKNLKLYFPLENIVELTSKNGDEYYTFKIDYKNKKIVEFSREHDKY